MSLRPIRTAIRIGTDRTAVRRMSQEAASRKRRSVRPQMPPVMCWSISSASDPSGMAAQKTKADRGASGEAAEREAPEAAGHVLEHQQRQRPERDGGPEDEGEQVRLEERVEVEERDDQR